MAIFEEIEVVASHQKLATRISGEMEALWAATDIIRKAVQNAPFPTEQSERCSDFLAASQIGLRVVNNAGACSQLIDRGYFAQAASHIRDTAETGMLALLFSEDPLQISTWRTAGKRRHGLFGRSQLREKIRQHEKFKFFNGLFDTFSQYGGHPSAETIIAHHDGERFHVGPHFNRKLYLLTYRDLAVATWHAADVCGALWDALIDQNLTDQFPEEIERFSASWAAISESPELLLANSDAKGGD